MADILIRGMEMPKDGHCIVRIYASGDVCEPTPCAGVWNKVAEAVPLPEGHGRLGDLDALMPDFAKARWEFFSDGDTFLRLLKNAPTIVPAEGGTDE